MWVFLAISHQIIPTVAALLSLSSPTTQLQVRMRGRKMAVHGKTTPPAPNPQWDFNFMPWEKSNQGFRVHVRKVWEYLLAGSARMMPATWMPWSHYWALKTFPRFNVYHRWKTWKRAFVLVLHLREHSTGFTVRASSIYISMVTSRTWPPPPNPFHPIHNAIFQENWVNKQRNRDELIIPRNLLSVIF